MKHTNTYIVKKFDVSKYNINVPKYYNIIKDETKISYLLLSYIYYNKYNKRLDISSIYKDKNGKPIFLDNKLYFNISHSTNYITCSLSNTNIGVDLEEDRIIKDTLINKIKNKNDIDLDIIQIWNIKEAYSKYLGIGLKLDFSKISINEIKKNINLISNIYNLKNNNLYLSLCYNIKENDIQNNINFIDKNELIKFYELT
mgnify:FL=1